MTTYAITWTETKTRTHTCTVEAESESAARQAWIDHDIDDVKCLNGEEGYDFAETITGVEPEEDDGERECIDCGETFNLAEGGTDFDQELGGPACSRCDVGGTVQSAPSTGRGRA